MRLRNCRKILKLLDIRKNSGGCFMCVLKHAVLDDLVMMESEGKQTESSLLRLMVSAEADALSTVMENQLLFKGQYVDLAQGPDA